MTRRHPPTVSPDPNMAQTNGPSRPGVAEGRHVPDVAGDSGERTAPENDLPLWGNRYFDDELSWIELGSGRPVILVHGGLSSAAQDWAVVGPLLAQRGRRVIAPDLPCHGQSDGDIDALDHPVMYRAVHRLVDRLALEGGHDIIGWSLGACVALHWLDADPESVRSLALVSTNLFPDERSRRSALQLDPERIRKRPEVVRRLNSWKIGERWPALTTRLSHLWQRSPDFPVSIFGTFPGHVLLAVGDRDNLIAHEQLLEAQRENRNVDLLVIPGAGHFVPQDPKAAQLLVDAASVLADDDGGNIE